MEFIKIWRILVGNKRIIIWLPIIATLSALALTYVLPEQYESTALVLVRPIEELKFSSNDRGNKEPADFPVSVSAPIDSLSKTYMEVIKSQTVAESIVDALHLDVKPTRVNATYLERLKDNLRTWIKDTIRALRNYFRYGRNIPATPYQLAVEDVENDLSVSARKDTYAFDITARSGNPAQAAAIANKAAAIFVEQSSEAHRNESALSRQFIEGQMAESRAALDNARNALLDYKNSGGTFELRSEYDNALKNISDLENTLAKAQGRLAGLQRITANATPTVIEQEAEIASLKGKIALLREQLETYPQKEKRLNALVLTERLAEESYEFFRKEYEQARIKEASTLTEIRIASPAQPDIYPVKPLKYLYAGLSFATALLLSLCWAFLFEALYPHVRSAQDLEIELGIPLLGTIPKSTPSGS